MIQLYDLCPCKSGKKFKFCCNFLTKMGSLSQYADEICRNFPVQYCCTMKDWAEVGKAPILVARLLPTGDYIIGMYLVDIFCLGVKDAFIRIKITLEEVKEFAKGIGSCGEGLQELTYEDARSIILGGLEYAARFGFAPHQDWELAKGLIEPNRDFNRSVTFGGRDGKPLYIEGSSDKSSWGIIRKVMSRGGHFIAQL